MKFQYKTMGLMENNENKKYAILDMKDNFSEWIEDEVVNLFGNYVAFVDNEYQAKKLFLSLKMK